MTAAPIDSVGIGQVFDDLGRLASVVFRLVRATAAREQALAEMDAWLAANGEQEESMRRRIAQVITIRDALEPTRECFDRLHDDLEKLAGELDALVPESRALTEAAEITLSTIRTVRGRAHTDPEVLPRLARVEVSVTRLRRAGEDLLALVEEAHDRVMVVLGHGEDGAPIDAEVAFRELGWDA